VSDRNIGLASGIPEIGAWWNRKSRFPKKLPFPCAPSERSEPGGSREVSFGSDQLGHASVDTWPVTWARPTRGYGWAGSQSPMPPPSGRRLALRHLPLLSSIVGIAIGVALVLSAVFVVEANNRMYWVSSVTVPAGANATNPFVVEFHGASFSLWWPPAPQPGTASTGLTGVDIQITEPSGVVDKTATGCGSCGSGTQYWYSTDGSVGVGFTDGSFENMTILVSF
jgi:hypothetical protein